MSAIVSPEQLLDELGRDDAPLLLDVRWTLAGADPAGYLAGHLPGAVFCDLDAVLSGPPGAAGRHPLPSRDRLAESLRRLGVGPRTRVVAYDGGVAAAAARAWWCLRWSGHADVRVLDGGLPAWVAAGGELERGAVVPVASRAPSSPGGSPAATGPSSAATGTSSAATGTSSAASAPSSATGSERPGEPTMRTLTAEAILTDPGGVLLDARAPERFRGEVEPVDPVAGHIPGARSLPAADLLDDRGRYLPVARLRELFTAVGADPGAPAAAYCGSGVSAAQLVLAAYEAGIDLALYPGSWSHWVTDPRRPVATGAG